MQAFIPIGLGYIVLEVCIVISQVGKLYLHPDTPSEVSVSVRAKVVVRSFEQMENLTDPECDCDTGLLSTPLLSWHPPPNRLSRLEVPNPFCASLRIIFSQDEYVIQFSSLPVPYSKTSFHKRVCTCLSAVRRVLTRFDF